MTLPEPAWRVRTRPCPFYQQGRCFFADSCNFLHTATFKAVAGTHIQESNATKDEHLSAKTTPLNPPLISVESPHSVRSPRLSGLLLALRDVIGDDPNEDTATASSRQENLTAGTNLSWSTSSSMPVSGNHPSIPSSDPSSPCRTTDIPPIDESLINDQHSLSDTSQNDGSMHLDSGSPFLPQHDSELESETSRINMSKASVDEEEEEYIEPVYAITHDNLLSPVETSHLRLANFARTSVDLTEHIVHQEDSQRPSAPLTLTSPRSSVRGSTFELLASPFGSPSSRVLSPRLSAFIGRFPHSTLDDTAEDRQPHDSDLDSPSARITENVDPPACVTESSTTPEETDVPSTVYHDIPPEIKSPEQGVTDRFMAKPHEGIPIKDVVLDEDTMVREEQDQVQVQVDPTEQRELPSMHGEENTKAEDCENCRGNEAFAGDEESHSGSISQWITEAESTVIYVGNQPLASKEIDGEAKCSSRFGFRSPEPQDVEVLEQDTSARLPTPKKHLERSTVAAQCASGSLPPSLSSAAVPLHSPSLYESDPGNHGLSDREQTSDNDVSADQPRLEDGDEMHEVDNLSIVDHTVLLPQVDDKREEQAVGPETCETLFDIYSEFSSPSMHSTPPVEVQPSRSRDVSTGESSSISTPLSSSHERTFSPVLPYGENHPAEYSLNSPSSAGVSSRPLAGLGSPFTIKQEGRDFGNGSECAQPRSFTGASRKVPLAWRSSLSSTHSNKPSRTSQSTSKPGPNMTRHHSPTGDFPSPYLSPSGDVRRASCLRPLRLSTLLTSQPSRSSPPPSFVSNHNRSQSGVNRHMFFQSSTVPSTASTSSIPHNHSLSSTRFSIMSDRVRTIITSSGHRTPSPLTVDHFGDLTNFGTPSPTATSPRIWRRASIYSQDEYSRTPSRLSEPVFHTIEEDESEDYSPEYVGEDEHIYNRVPSSRSSIHSAPVDHIVYQPVHAISTPKPDLMFAIASDDVTEVKRVLHSGDANPNDVVGPQTALEFALTNDRLSNKIEIIKALLAYGADPAVLRKHSALQNVSAEKQNAEELPSVTRLIDDVDPALKYYIERADAPDTRRTSALIHRSFFRPLTKVRYELIGQDCVLEQLFRVLSIQSRGFSVAPMVVLLCGPSGHGKSLLARKFGSLLDVPTHTVNMTTLKSTYDIWRSHSMSPYETPTTCTLAEFLINNEGKRCVVVLDEIEKTDESTLWSLLMPWELGRCSFEAGTRHIDVRNVVWLGTSNIGHDLIFKYNDSRPRPHDLMGREEYLELMKLLRPLVSERLGASVLSRMTAVLPFVPFTPDEKMAISSEALFALGGDSARALSIPTVESVIQDALTNYCAAEGARSLYRAISNQLMEII